MKLKHLLLGIALISCCGLFLTSCEDEMGLGGSAGDLNPPSNSYSNKSIVDSIFSQNDKNVTSLDVINN
uniref:hypothetical protein n=1 Tax=uncultured Dysgonomonas sp. TaxID=206096 RepID=UPI00260B0A7D|nr:hypothetical protein [uncultured Dysgonomonas sp.]